MNYRQHWLHQTIAPPKPGWKYGRQHSWECTCTDCLKSMAEHEQLQHNRCTCQSCAFTRAQLNVIAETERRGREAQAISKGAQPMANISICDRINCGSMTKANVAGVLEVGTGGDTPERVAGQLCPACVSDLVVWWELDNVGPRDRAYTKAWKRLSAPQDMSYAELMRLAIDKGREELENQ